ncbi:Serine/threonine-protein kinase PAK 7 [Liparis tanakae]|uniref:non-specific serine/threonine protein kinase n=1 Tax=Liparis tanakae TaxID=230148 RepID=A0A4Z2FLV8_9TELE|nr:Serine/threonine-protein kinase PAK 7 [Liparis tanakae]
MASDKSPVCQPPLDGGLPLRGFETFPRSSPHGCVPGCSSMFGKKKKRLEISAPSNFEHRVHTGFDPREQKFTGLPQQWQSLLADTANRPKPMVDPSYITPIQLAPMKVRV